MTRYRCEICEICEMFEYDSDEGAMSFSGAGAEEKWEDFRYYSSEFRFE